MHGPRATGFRELAATGVPLGLLETAEYESEEIVIQAGESVLLYTDGVTEAMNRSRDQFGEERLQEILGKSVKEGPQVVRDRVVAAVRRFQGKEPASDDLTLLVLKRTE
jgi:sigma-B regulation protein RsbU (phosphoserine phosphatase)